MLEGVAQLLQGTDGRLKTLHGDMGVQGGGPQLAVPEELLDRANIAPRLQEGGGKAVSEGVGSDVFAQARHLSRLATGPRDRRGLQRLGGIAAGK